MNLDPGHLYQTTFVYGQYILLGGIYLDTDVELLKPIDNLPNNFLAIEKDYELLATGLGFGAKKGNEVLKDLLKIYDKSEFDKNKIHSTTITEITMNYFYDKGYNLDLENIHEYLGFTIYPDYYFCPKSNINKTIDLREETISIHHYIGSWAM